MQAKQKSAQCSLPPLQNKLRWDLSGNGCKQLKNSYFPCWEMQGNQSPSLPLPSCACCILCNSHSVRTTPGQDHQLEKKHLPESPSEAGLQTFRWDTGSSHFFSQKLTLTYCVGARTCETQPLLLNIVLFIEKLFTEMPREVITTPSVWSSVTLATHTPIHCREIPGFTSQLH